jgi:hypothetical protein
MLSACSVQAAPLWHSIVLDDYSTNDQALGPIDGFTTGSALPDIATDATGSSITNRRDMAIFRDATASGTEPVNAAVQAGQFTYTQDTSGGSVGFGAMLQNDYADAITGGGGNVYSNGLNLTGNGVIASAGYSRYVLDLDAATDAGFTVTFTVFGATTADYAQSTKVTSGGAELLTFDIWKDFQSDLFGDFATNPLSGKSGMAAQPTWADVTGFGINIDAQAAGANFVLNETYATIPEPGSMLAMAGLFGGAGLVGFRRKRAAKKAAKA